MRPRRRLVLVLSALLLLLAAPPPVLGKADNSKVRCVRKTTFPGSKYLDCTASDPEGVDQVIIRDNNAEHESTRDGSCEEEVRFEISSSHIGHDHGVEVGDCQGPIPDLDFFTVFGGSGLVGQGSPRLSSRCICAGRGEAWPEPPKVSCTEGTRQRTTLNGDCRPLDPTRTDHCTGKECTKFIDWVCRVTRELSSRWEIVRYGHTGCPHPFHPLGVPRKP